MHARTHSVCQQSVLLHSSGELQVYDLCSRSSGELQGTTCALQPPLPSQMPLSVPDWNSKLFSHG
eukprot:scaffold37366_cov18-Tisochrysis_lutea.AAC.1